MKVLLGISLVLNIVLSVLYFKKESLPPIERIVIEEKEVTPPSMHNFEKRPRVKAPKTKEQEAAPGPRFDTTDYADAFEQTERKKEEYLAELGITEEMEQKKKALELQFFNDLKAISDGQSNFNLDFNVRRKMIDLEENLHKKYETIYGKKKWQTYKKFVDQHNKKMLDDLNRTGESDRTMISY